MIKARDRKLKCQRKIHQHMHTKWNKYAQVGCETKKSVLLDIPFNKCDSQHSMLNATAYISTIIILTITVNANVNENSIQFYVFDMK